MESFHRNHPPDYERIAHVLETALGVPDRLHQSSPLASCHSGLEVLLATVLTQATNDRNALQAWRQLQNSFPDPAQLLKASPPEVAAIIRPAGLAGQKAATILGALRGIQERCGALTLEGLKTAPFETAYHFLVGLPGIGPKTAACTMLFGLEMPAFPVDTHIYRIIRRLGWVDPQTDSAVAQFQLSRAIPIQLLKALHILLLNLGRLYCRPVKPHCYGTTSCCPLHAECPAAPVTSASPETE